MLVIILLGALVLAVPALVAVDVARTKADSLPDQVDGSARHGTPMIVRAASDGLSGASAREPVGTAIPTAADDAGRPRQPERISPSVGGHQQSRTSLSAVPKRSRYRLTNWSVRSRLSLLVIIPAAAVTVIAFCVAGLTSVLHGARIHSASGSARAGAILSALEIGVVVGVVLVLAVWLTIVVARSVLRPLYRLRTRALAAASGREADATLPIGEEGRSDLKPVDVDSPDEIGDVARVFQQMRHEMLRMSTNEATLHDKLDTMFVNLSHRSQSLVERQIRFIEWLEQGEQDRERLANLSRINRIASRMYRNSQNLLILAGHELSVGWNQPMALVNVIRAAVSEIEEYDRVSLHAHPDIAVTGPAVNDAVHLLAELTENATSFSATDMPVEISSQLVNSGGAVIDITDRGVGMSTKELAYANWRLENPSMTDIDVPKWIGLVVVARLAARHGIRVRLQQAEFGGLTALVWLPDEVITSPAAATSPASSGFGSTEPRHGSHEAAEDLGLAVADRNTATVRSAESAPALGNPRNALNSRRLLAEAGRRPGPAWPTDAVPETGPAATAGSSGSGPSEAIGEQVVASSQAPTFSGAVTGDVADYGLAQDQLPDSGSSMSSRNWTSQPASAQLTTAAPTTHEAKAAEADLIVPSAEDGAEERRLPIYDAVESQWFRAGAGRDALGSSDLTPTTRSSWSSPADEGWRAAETAESPSSGAATAAGLPRRQPKTNLVPGAIPNTEPATLPNRSATTARERLAGLQRGLSKGRAAASEAVNEEP